MVPPGADTREDVAHLLIRALVNDGTSVLYGVPGGGSNLDVIGAAEEAGCRFVLAHSESAATMMAAVTAEMTGTPGAVVVTRGPGAASAVNGAAQALLDRQPLLLVTDCVGEGEAGRISHQRLDQRSLFSPVTKGSFRLGRETSEALVRLLTALAMHAPPGPVHLDLDHSVKGASPPSTTGLPVECDALDRALTALEAARRPVAIVGVGARALHRDDRLDAVTAIRSFVEAGDIPTLTTYKGRGIVSDRSGCFAGVATGATIEAAVLNDADLIVGIGLDPVEFVPGPWPYAAPVVLMGSWRLENISYFGDHLWAEAIGPLAQLLDGLTSKLRTDWQPGDGSRYEERARRRLIHAAPDGTGSSLSPSQVVRIAREEARAGTVATVDSGAHMLLAVPLWTVEEPGELLISSGLATMGFALPAAIAAAIVDAGRHVICFTGDGGLGMTLAELETATRLALPVVVVVFNDATLSLIAIKQRAEGHGGPNAVHYRDVNFAAVASACGMASERVSYPGEYRNALRRALSHKGPTLLDVTIDPRSYAAILEAIRGPGPEMPSSARH